MSISRTLRGWMTGAALLTVGVSPWPCAAINAVGPVVLKFLPPLGVRRPRWKPVDVTDPWVPPRLLLPPLSSPLCLTIGFRRLWPSSIS